MNSCIACILLATSFMAVQSASKPAATLTQSAETVEAVHDLAPSKKSAETVYGKLATLDWSMSMTQLRNRITAMADQGESPVSLKAWIDTQLLPQVRQTAQELQGEADGAEQRVKDCDNLLWSAERESSHRQSILEKDESDRFACIGEEHRLHHEEQQLCGDMNFVADLVVKTQPKSLSSITNRTVDEVEAVLRESQQFFSDFYPKLVQKQSGCASAREAATNQHATCEADEEVIEQFYCTMKFGRDQACLEYDACYEQQSAAFDKTVDEVKDLEVHIKNRFKKLTCYSEYTNEGLPNCNDDTINVAQLSVSYATKPQKQQCGSLMHTRRSYDDIVCKEGSVVPHGDHPGDAAPSSSNASTADSNSTNTNLLVKDSAGIADDTNANHLVNKSIIGDDN